MNEQNSKENGGEPNSFYGFSLDTPKTPEKKVSVNEPATEEELKPLNPPEKSEMMTESNGEKDDDDFKRPNSPVWDNPHRNNNFPEEKKLEKIEKKPRRKICEDFEQILDIVGGAGKYQKIILYAILCPIVTISPFMVLNTIFMWDVPDHWCRVDGRDPSMSMEEWKNMTLPWEKGPDGLMRHSQCKMYSKSDNKNGSSEEEEDFKGRDIVACLNGWEYDTTDYSSTIPSDYNWVCDHDYYATDCFTWGSVGSAVGTVIFGIMADKYGRKPIFFLACAVNVAFKTVSLFLAHHYFTYKLFQLLGGMAFPAVFSMPALISAEASGNDYRAWIYAVTWMIWVVGNSLLPFVAMVCRGWFLFGCVAAVPACFLFFYYPIVDDSPRWLITAGRTDEALKIILKIAKTNKKKVDVNELEQMVKELGKKLDKEKETQSIGVWTLFSKARLARNTIMLTIAWTMNSLLYYGVTLNTTHMAGNKFINYFVLALIELPGGWLAGKLVDITGRRWTQVALFSLCTLSCLLCAVAVAYPNSAAIVIIGALGIKFGVSITSLVAYLQGTEIFPTQLRSTGSGLSTTVASTIGIFGPYIVYSGYVHVSLPYSLLCLCSFLGLLSAACLPETYQQNLPETVEDANSFGKHHKFWSYLPQAQEKKRASIAEGALHKRNSSVISK